MNSTRQDLATREDHPRIEQSRARNTLLPLVDIFEDEEGIVLVADMPGVSSRDLDIQVNDNVLSLEGEIKVDVPSGTEASFAELRGTRYERRFTLSRELDTDRIEADLKNGVLRLRVPKRAEHRPRRIEIKS